MQALPSTSGYRLLPENGERVEQAYKFRSCAVVGNSGALRYMRLGVVSEAGRDAYIPRLRSKGRRLSFLCLPALRMPWVTGMHFVQQRKRTNALATHSHNALSVPQTIDMHDVVVRLNQAPTDRYSPWVGSKTTFRMLNRLWTAHYANGRFERMNLPMERGVTFVVRHRESLPPARTART